MESAADLSFDVCRLSQDSVLSSDQISGSHDLIWRIHKLFVEDFLFGVVILGDIALPSPGSAKQKRGE